MKRTRQLPSCCWTSYQFSQDKLKRPRRRTTTRRRCFRLLSSSHLLIMLCSLWSLSSHYGPRVVHAEMLVYSSTPLPNLFLVRGGDGDVNNDDNDDDDDDDKYVTNRFLGLRKDWLWATGALFRLKEHVLAEALRDTTLSTKNPTNGRGGALLVKRRVVRHHQPAVAANVKLSSSGGSSSSNSDNNNSNHKSSPQQQQQQHQLTPFDTSRVSPLDKRLLVDEGGGDANNKNNSTQNNKTNAANSLWWANVWAQQILDDADHENKQEYNIALDQNTINNKRRVTVVVEQGDDDDDQSRATNKNQGASHQQQQQEAVTETDQVSLVESTKEDKKQRNNQEKASASTGESTSPTTTTTTTDEEDIAQPQSLVPTNAVSPHASSGYWGAIDQVASLGLATFHPAYRISRHLRSARKATARVTGWHGLLSGKGRSQRQRRGRLTQPSIVKTEEDGNVPLDEDDLGMIRRRIAAIDRARETLERAAAAEAAAKRQMRWTWLLGSSKSEDDVVTTTTTIVDKVGEPVEVETGTVETDMTLELGKQTLAPAVPAVKEKSREELKQEEKLRKERAKEEELEEKRRKEKAKQDELEEQRRIEKAKEEEREQKKRTERVMAIDKLILEGQFKLQELQCEKDALQRRPNPLWNYTTETRGSNQDPTYTRTFNFPPPELVEEYLEVLFWSGRLVKLNHTHLWKNAAELDDEDDDETIGDDLLTPSGDAYKLYEKSRRTQQQQQQLHQQLKQQQKRQQRLPGDEIRRGNGGGGSWLLRQTIGTKTSLGEKIGETAETAAYKGVCQALMGVLARGLSALHGVNILSYSDIRLFMEQSPDLPPLGGVLIPGSSGGNNYAQQALKDVMRRGARKNKRRKQNRLSDEAGIQRDAIVETLLSHCQISAPLLKLFPLAWQRALLGNIITLVSAVVSDFCEGVQFQILGHQLSFLFKPITESDVIQHIGMAGHGFNHRRARPDQFEAAVRATADEINGNLKFLDRWHERALGGGMLRAQIADLIARLVLTLFDEVLCGARMDLWSAQAGGPRLVAGLEYRTTSNYVVTSPLPPSGN